MTQIQKLLNLCHLRNLWFLFLKPKKGAETGN